MSRRALVMVALLSCGCMSREPVGRSTDELANDGGLRLCAGGSEVRVGVRVWDGNFSANLFANENGSQFLFLDTACRLWLDDSPDEWITPIKTADLDEAEARLLLDSLSVDSWSSAYGTNPPCVGPDHEWQSVTFGDSGGSFTRNRGCAEPQYAAAITSALDAISALGTPTPLSQLRIRVTRIDAPPAGTVEFEWPLARPAAEVALEPDGQPEVCGESFRVEGNEASAFEVVRAQIPADYPFGAVMVEGGEYFSVLIRDALPFEDDDGIVREVGDSRYLCE